MLAPEAITKTGIPARSYGIWRLGTVMLAAVLALMLVASKLIAYHERTIDSTVALVEHSHHVMGAINHVLQDGEDAEASQRGFLLTGDAAYLKPYFENLRLIWDDFGTLATLTADNTSQQERLMKLAPVIRAKLAVMATTIRFAQGGDLKDALTIVRSDSGKNLMDGVRHLSADFIGAERLLLQQRRYLATHNNFVSYFAIIGLSGVGFALILFGGAIAVRSTITAVAAAERNQLFEMAGAAAIIIHDLDGTIRLWSEGCRRLYGWTAEQAVGRRAHELLHTAFPAAAADIESALRRDGEWSGELRQRTRDGEEVIVAARKIVHAVAQAHRHELVVEHMVDITMLRRTETLLRENQAYLQSFVETAADGIVVAETNGRIQSVNPAMLRMFGYDLTEALIGRNLQMLMPQTEAARHDGYIAAHRAGAPPRVIGVAGRELLAVRKDGSEFPIDLSVSSFGINGSRFLTGIIRDATARQQAERATQERQLLLEQSNSELIRARLRAEQSTRAKSRFLAGMSHELRTPLNGILGYAQLLGMEGGLNAAQAARVDSMRAAGQHLLEMITNILDLSEIESERVELQITSIDPRSVAEECVNVLRPSARAKGLALSLETAGDVPQRVAADPTRLRQVLLNLLANAVKFTDHGSINLRLSMVRPAGAADRLLIEIIDTGRGVVAARRGDLFQDFERLGADPDNAIEGAGLGLAISARLVSLMGGHIVHNNNPGGGSIFSFEMPLSAAAVIDPAASKEHAAAEPTVDAAVLPPCCDALRILLVDDIAMNRDIAGSFLKVAGHDVTFADGGEAAVAAAAAADFDVILMDLRMPEIDGFEATRRIHAIGGRRGRVPIIAFTAHAFTEQVEECRRAGMIGHLAKPFTQAALLAVLAEARQERSSSLAPAGEPDGATLPLINLDTYEATTALLLPDMVATYLNDIVGGINDLLKTIQARNTSTIFDGAVADAVHTLGGKVGMVGFARLNHVARQFEREARSGAAETPALAQSLTAVLELSLQEAQRRLLSARTTVSESVQGRPKSEPVRQDSTAA